MRRLTWVVALLLGLILPFGGPLPALAQGQVEIKAPPPHPRPGVLRAFSPDGVPRPQARRPLRPVALEGPAGAGRHAVGSPRDRGLARLRLQLRLGHSHRERDGPVAGVPAPSFLRLPDRSIAPFARGDSLLDGKREYVLLS